jgi:hypothetical protein
MKHADLRKRWGISQSDQNAGNPSAEGAALMSGPCRSANAGVPAQGQPARCAGRAGATGTTGASSKPEDEKQLRITGEVRRMARASSWPGSGSCGRPRPPRRLAPDVGCPKYQPRAGSKRSQPRLDGSTGAQSHLPPGAKQRSRRRVELSACARPWQWGEIQLIKNFIFTNRALSLHCGPSNPT